MITHGVVVSAERHPGPVSPVTARTIDRPTPEEIAYAYTLITEPKYLPDDRERRASYMTARAMGLIQFAAGDTFADAETNLRRVRAAVVAERTALHELYPGQYNDPDPFHYEQETTDAEAPARAGTVAPEPEAEPARAAAQAGPEGPAAAQAGAAAPAAPEMTPLEAVTALNAITGNDPEGAHAEADRILHAAAPPTVAAAYDALIERADGWWFA